MGIALDCIAVYLDEEEVTDQVSVLKKDYSEPYLPGAEGDELGLENATLRWNEIAEHIEGDNGTPNGGPPTVMDETRTAVGDRSSERNDENVERTER
jgi:hypothetical protein